MYALPLCLVVMRRQVAFDKIVFACLHFIAYSHLICCIKVLIFLVKVENMIFFYFYVFINLCKSALSNIKNLIREGI